MARRTPRNATPARAPFAMAVKERRHADGTRETLTITASEVIHVRTRGERNKRASLPLADLEDVRAGRRVRDLDLVVALAYILGAAVMLYVLVNAFSLLDGLDRVLVFALCTAAATVGALVAWLGQEAVLVFVGRGRRIRYPIAKEDAKDVPQGRLRGRGG